MRLLSGASRDCVDSAVIAFLDRFNDRLNRFMNDPTDYKQ